jgi:hypothetical protein
MEIAPPFCFVCEEGEPKAQSWRFFEKQITKVPTFYPIVMFMVTLTHMF